MILQQDQGERHNNCVIAPQQLLHRRNSVQRRGEFPPNLGGKALRGARLVEAHERDGGSKKPLLGAPHLLLHHDPRPGFGQKAGGDGELIVELGRLEVIGLDPAHRKHNAMLALEHHLIDAERAETDQALALMLAIIDRLGPPDRQILLLYLEGMPAAEIAASAARKMPR